jgi:uncharacterized OsmC-like protein
MNAEELRAAQAPLKARYKQDAATALITHVATAEAEASAQVSHVQTFLGVTDAGLHPAAGGDGSQACSADMLLQALVGCAGVTLGAVATAMGITLKSARIRAEGQVDFRGTLGVSREAPVGFKSIKLVFDLDTEAAPETVAKLLELTERYCVVYQTLVNKPQLTVVCASDSPSPT